VVGRSLVLVIFCAALLWPASALAASGALVNGVMSYTADPNETNQVVFQVSDFGEPTFEVVDRPGVVIQAASPCFTSQPNVMECPQDGNGSGQITLLSVSLGDGNDTISIQANLPTTIGAGGGNDTMSGGPAADFLRGGQGADAIDGGSGNDQLTGDDPGVAGGGDDSLNGGAGNDSADGQDGNDTVRGGDGDDTLSGGDGNDTFPAEAAPDGADVLSQPLQLSLDDQPNDGLQGNATDNVQSDVENLVGGSAGDAISGSGSANALDGGNGDDTIAGAGGDDALTGDAGNDTESGDDGADSVSGGTGSDVLDGGAGDDVVAGGDDADVVRGGDGGDQIAGDGGDDTLDGGAGPDVFAGGDGTDTGDYSVRTGNVAVTLDGIAGDGEFAEGDNVEPDVENLRGGSGADTFIGSAAGNALDGGAGEDYEDGGAGADALTGGENGDVLRTRGSPEGDTVTCGPGPDFVVAKASDTIAPDCDRADRGVNQKPKRRDSAVVAPVRGSLQMSPTGIVRRVPLQDKVVLPLRSIVDTVAGAVKVTSAPTTRLAETVSLQDGAFDITQTAAKLSVTQFALVGGDFTVCPAARRAGKAGAAAAPKTVRILWASGKGKFRTKGRYASASIRGTRWQTQDRCDGTLIRVTSGVVSVRDLVKKKTVVVKAGHTYLAKAR
jgi:Ca2+-binding RTX toxin-like protein